MKKAPVKQVHMKVCVPPRLISLVQERKNSSLVDFDVKRFFSFPC
jgi:hypothetical protein